MIKKILLFFQDSISLIFIFTIKFYQIFLSPIILYLFGPSCRFQPSCSQYAIESFREYPFLIALYLSTKRILRCHPINEGGYDPVPKTLKIQILNKKFTFFSKTFIKTRNQ
ncbi:MAG: membrane protein insertion efficiency factor YidD [Leptonema sp. (in: bacteria)]